MALEDKEKTTFMAKRCIYYNTIRHFGLKNIGATYQYLINKVFNNQIDQNMKVYINDMLVKSAEGN